MMAFWLFFALIAFLLVAATEARLESFRHAPPMSNGALSDRHLSSNRRRTQQMPDMIQRYELWSSEEIRDRVLKWAVHYPDLIRVTTSQEAYGLPAAGGADDCPFEAVDGCLNYILVIQDFVAHPEGSPSDQQLPELLWSGLVHGDEQVGPTSALESAQLLLDAASCEALPRPALKGTSEYATEVANARTCRDELASLGIDDTQRQWLARLVSTRRIVVVPTANALGYYRSVRTEGDIDPNRDFPYNLKDWSQCMQSVAARTLNEVFREHMFLSSFTFHGGMEVIGYEWGAPEYKSKPISPDDTAQATLASAYSRFGAGWTGDTPYEYGNMNDFVYPVRGGMEDWAYAGSWDTDRVQPCEPTTFGGYPKEKTTYDGSTLRVFNMLVESSDDKIPAKETLGTSQELLGGTEVGNGYVTRNIRLCMLSAELLQPYIAMESVNDLTLTNDVIPLTPRNGRTCQTLSAVSVPPSVAAAHVQWRVGGALIIDETQLWYAKWEDVPESALDCLLQPNMDDINEYFESGEVTSESSGSGRYSENGSSGSFAGSIDLTGFAPGDKLVVVVSARVDQNWKGVPGSAAPDVPPQSHIVNARTNSSWYHESSGKIIQGRLDWFSMPLTIVIDSEGSTDTVELSNRFVEAAETNYDDDNSHNASRAGGNPSNKAGAASFDPNGSKSGSSSLPPPPTNTGPDSSSNAIWSMIMLASVVAVVGVVGRAYLKSRMRSSRRERVREFIQDASAPTPGLRHTRNGYSDIDSELEMGEYS